MENLKSYRFLIGNFLAETICFNPFARYKSYSGLSTLRKEVVLLIIHLRTIPEGSLEMEKTFLSVILIEIPFYLLFCPTYTP